MKNHDDEVIKAIEILKGKGITLDQIAEAMRYLELRGKDDDEIGAR